MKFTCSLTVLILLLLHATGLTQTTTTFIPLRSGWRYLDNGSNQGTAWRAAAFDDSTWPQGTAELGYGDGDEATVVGYGGNASAKYITTYFRKSFTVTNAAGYTAATVRVRRDDGVVVYLNGTEIFRSNMPAGTVTHTTLASAAAADETTLFSGTVSPALLLNGTNVIAAEIHQNAASSSDISFELDFTGTIPGNVPAANAQSVSTTEDTAKAITLTGSDPNGDPITFAIATPPAKGALSGTPPNVTYTPNLNSRGADSFTFTVSDGTNVSPPAPVSLTVTAVNDVPVANTGAMTLTEDGSVTFDISGSDVESRYGMLPDYTQQLHNGALAITDGLSGATWNANTGTLFLIRNDSAGAGHSYECTADGTILRTITQSGFLDTEAIAWMYGDTYAIAEENNNQRISIVTIDPGATTLDRTAPGNVTWTTPVGSLLNLGIESLCYDAGRDVLYYMVEKPDAGAWLIYSMNPQTGISTVLCDVNASIAAAGMATDLSDMAFDRATDTILLLSHESNRIIRVDRSGTVLEQRGFTTALTQAEMLALTPDRQRLWVGGEPKQFTRLALPADTLTYNLVTPPAHGSLSGIPPRVTYTPVPNFNGLDSFTFRMWDGTVYSTAATVTLNITPVNDPPAGGEISTTAEATEPTLIVLPASDPDGDALTIQTTTPAHGSVTVDGTTVTYTAVLYQGPDSFTYTVSDGALTAGPFTVNINVLQFNNAPAAGNGSVQLNEDTPAPLTLAATDAENDPLTWTVLTQPAHGTLSGTAPDLTFTPAADYHGADSFTFRVSDGLENSNTATVSLTIAPVNDAPVAAAGSGNVEAGYPLPLTLGGSDADGDALTFAIVDQPLHGTLTGTAPNVTYTPDIAYAGVDTFTFTASDGTLTSAPAAVTITIAPYNQPPVASDGNATTDEDVAFTVALVASDPESSPLIYTIVTPPAHGTLSGTGANRTYTPALNYSGPDSFTWTAGDGAKTSPPAVCSITVNPVNDAPVAQALAVSTEAGAAVPIILTGTDPENQPLTFAVVSQPAHGTLSGNASALTYTPASGYTGADSITFTANDGALDSPPATVNLTVTAPVLDNLVSAGSVWKYLADGSNQGTAWRAPSFTDTAWPQGPAQLGYGDGDEATVVPYGPDVNNRWITTYFRREFQVPNPNILTGPLKLDLMRDDGAVVYLNGTEVFRSNMPAGTIAWNTLAPASVAAADESAYFSTTFSSSLIAPGRNVLAVEIHQNVATSSDISFDLKLYETMPSITRGPYVQMTGTDRATVRWRTNVAVGSVLNYGTAEGALTASVTSATPKTEHEVHVTALAPDTRYYYSAGYPLATLAGGPAYYFTTHPPVNTARPFRFWVLGDAGTGTTNQTSVRDAFYTWNGAQNVDGVLLLGDNVYETGTDTEYQTRFFDMYPTKLRNTTFWPCFGNHDAGSASSGTQTGPYYDSFTMPKFAEAGGLASGTEAYYSLDYGNIHFVCLDSEGTGLTSNGAMAQWLQADLAANSREWTVAFWHHPPYSKGSHDSDVPTADSGKMKNMREVIVPILESYGVDLMLFGHEHTYLRSKFVDGHYGVSTTFDPATMLKQAGMGTPGVDGPYFKPSGAHTGAVFTVAGSSGKLDALTRNLPVMALHLNELGSVVLDVNGRELQARFLNSSGTVRDNYAIFHNDLPVAGAATVSGTEDTPLPFLLSASDADGDPLNWTIVTPPATGTLSGTAPNLTWTPPANFNGSATLEFRVNDGRQNSATAMVTLNIAPVNDAPLAVAGSAATNEDTPAILTLAGSDADGDAIFFSITTPPAHGTLSGTAPDMIYTPDANWHGSDSFGFTVNDGTASSAPALFSLTVAPVNDAPEAAAVSVEATEDSPVQITLSGSDSDGDSLNFVITSLPLHGTLSGTLPELTYIPDPDWHGTDSFRYLATDGTADSAPATVTLTVTPVNDAPLAAAGSATMNEDTPGGLLLNGSDKDGDPLGFTVSRPPVHGTLSGSPPALIYTPDANWHGSDDFEFTSHDGTIASLPAVFTIVVSPVNDAPVAAGFATETAEDAPVNLTLTLTGTDADGDTLTFIITSPPAHGLLSGTLPDLTYIPDTNWHGADSFTFAVSDGQSVSDAGVATITVAPVNDLPAAADQSLTMDEDTAVPVLLEATDADGDALTFTVTILPQHGTLSGTAPSLTYTPDTNWNGPDSFSFTAADGAEASPPAVVSIAINPVNDLPVAAPQSLSADEDTALPLTLAAADAEGDALTFSITAPPLHGTLSGTPPELIYTPAANWNGPDSFEFSASDGTASSAPALVSIGITAVNDSPAASAQSLDGTEDTTLPVTLAGTDIEGSPLTFTITSPPAHGTLSGTAPDLIYTPDANWHGADTFSFAVSDGETASAPAVVAMTIAPVNDEPSATAQSLATGEDTALPITLAATDADGDPLTFSITAPPLHGTLSGTAPDLIYTPDAEWHGSDSFAFTAGSGTATSSAALVEIVVAPVNDAPTAAPQTLAANEDSALPLLLAATDPDGDALAFSVTVPPQHGTLSGTAPGLTYTPAADWNGSDSFTYISSDGTLESIPAVVTLTVSAANDPPAAAALFAESAEDTPANVTLSGSDTDGDPLGFVITSLPAHGTLSGTLPVLTYVPESNWHGTDSFTYLATDGTADSVPAAATITITPVNDAPTAAAQLLVTLEDSPLPVILTATDADGDALTFSITVPPLHGSLSGTAPNLTYTPDADFHGTDSFTFTSADASEAAVAAVVAITVSPVNDPPVAAAQSLATGEDTALPITLIATDADGDVLTFAITASPLHGTLSGTAPDLVYTPAANYHGPDSFEFSASGPASSAPASVSIEITAVNDAPAAAPQFLATNEDTDLPVTLTGTDADGDALTFTVTVPPQHGTLSGRPPALIYTPGTNYHGADSFMFTVSDGASVSTPAAVNLAIASVNDAPSAATLSEGTAEDTPVNITFTGTDADGDTLSFVITSLPAHGTLSGTLPSLTYIPNPDWHGADTFSYLAADGTADSAPASVSIEITAVNDAPAAAPQSLATNEDTDLPVTLTGTDADGDALTFTVTVPPQHGTLSGTAPNLTYTPEPNWNGTDSFAFAAHDAMVAGAPAVMTIVVAAANDAPAAAPDSVTGPEDTPLPVTLAGTDAEGAPLTFSIAVPPQHGTLSGTAPQLTYTPAPNWNGSDSFTFTVNDGQLTSPPAVVNLVITSVNDAPVAAAQSRTVNEDTALPVTLTATDPDGDALAFSITVPPQHGTLSGTAPGVTYTPVANYYGPDSFTFTASDGTASHSAVVSITVNAVNDAPVASPLAVSTEVGAPVSFILSGTDVEGGPLTGNLLTTPARGTLSGTFPALTYTPNLAWSGTDSFTFTVSDGELVSSPATVTLTVAAAGPWQLVLRTGHSVPGVPGAPVSLINTDFVSDAAGRASFRATAGTLTGIWTEGDAGLEAVAVQGGTVPGVSGAVFDPVTVGPWAAGNGELLLYARMTPAVGGVTTSTDYGYWLRSGSNTKLVAREGSAPASLPATAKFSALSTAATLEAGGNFAFAASLTTSSALGITSANDTGLWGTFGSPLRLITRENNPAPGSTDGGVFDTLTSAVLSSNGSGQLAFTTSLKVAGTITTANRYGLWLWDPSQFGLIARGGHQAPGTAAGAVFAQPQQPSLGGSLLFRSTLATTGGGVTTSTDTGLWMLENGSVALAAREGFQAPGVTAGGLFNQFAAGAAVNGTGEYTFTCTLRTGGGVTSANNAGVWSRSRFTANTLALTARKGSIAPGAGSATFSAFDAPFMAGDGGEAFTGSLTQSTTTGVTASNDRGLWVRNATGGIVMALREGSLFTLAPGDARTVAEIKLPPTQLSGRKPLSDEGRLLVLISFTDSSTALYHYTLP